MTPIRASWSCSAHHGRHAPSKATRSELMRHRADLRSRRRLGVFSPEVPRSGLSFPRARWASSAATSRNSGDAKRGRHHHAARNALAAEAVPGFKEVKPVVFCGLYPSESERLRTASSSRWKSSSSTTRPSQCEPETSQALGFGFRCGFLGLLHMEIIQERLEREFQRGPHHYGPLGHLPRCSTTDGTTTEIDNPSKLPDPAAASTNLYEPLRHASTSIVPSDYVGNVMKLCQDKRGIQKNMGYLGPEPRRTSPTSCRFAEIVFDFFDRLKSATRGYASMDYEVIDYRASNLVRLDILLNGDSRGRPRGHRAQGQILRLRGVRLALKLKRTIPRQMFEVAIQAAIGAEGHRPRDHFRAPQERNSPSATAATLPVSASSSKSRRKAKSA